jgi:hypothetical protein
MRYRRSPAFGDDGRPDGSSHLSLPHPSTTRQLRRNWGQAALAFLPTLAKKRSKRAPNS